MDVFARPQVRMAQAACQLDVAHVARLLGATLPAHGAPILAGLRAEQITLLLETMPPATGAALLEELDPPRRGENTRACAE
eukprot:1658009-Pyramimonas_sp.AAC.1